MVDVSSLLASISGTIDLAKQLLSIREIANSVEAQMAISKLSSKLVDAESVIRELKRELSEKDDHIFQLEKRIAQREALVRHNELYFNRDSEGKPTGDPYCPKCFEAQDRLIHLVSFDEYKRQCKECGTYWPKSPGLERPRPTQAITDFDPF